MMIIDAFEFARKALEASGSIALEDLERLDVLERSGSLDWRAAGSCDSKARPFLDLTVNGKLVLACQRCLEPMVQPIAVTSHLWLAQSEAEADAVPLDEPAFDVVVGSEEFDLAELIEDEIILSLPLVPKHERCRGTGTDQADRAAANGAPESARFSPFASLASVRKHNR